MMAEPWDEVCFFCVVCFLKAVCVRESKECFGAANDSGLSPRSQSLDVAGKSSKSFHYKEKSLPNY